jgi:hypothetical protein
MEGGKGNNREKGENDKEIENMHSGEWGRRVMSLRPARGTP